MMCRFSQLRRKEVINICDGSRLGCVGDLELCIPEGTVKALIVFGPCRFFGLFGRGEDYYIPWDSGAGKHRAAPTGAAMCLPCKKNTAGAANPAPAAFLPVLFFLLLRILSADQQLPLLVQQIGEVLPVRGVINIVVLQYTAVLHGADR